MNGSPFKLGRFARGKEPFTAIVLDDQVVPLASAAKAYGEARGRGLLAETIDDLLANWDANFATLQEIVAYVEGEGLGRFVAGPLVEFRARPPVARPGKMFYAAQNFQEHVDEMLRSGMSKTEGGKQFTGDKKTTRPYLFLKAPSCLTGAYDDIEIPLSMTKIDWEAEIALAIGKPGKRIKAERALDHVAGFMTTNDVSCRDLQVRQDRPALRSDWLGGKCHDGFAPMGPVLVPRTFVPDHTNLFIRLSVNGQVKQNGNTSQFIFTPEEQIEYASNLLSLQTADIFVCGTCGGVGQGTHTFLTPGDVMETEVQGLGRMRNLFGEERAA